MIKMRLRTKRKTKFAGSLVNLPHKHKYGKIMKTRLKLALTDLLEDLGAKDDDSIFVTLVPKSAIWLRKFLRYW